MENVSGMKQRFKARPTMFYALSICASWAGVGSLMNSVTMTKDFGIVPSLMWSAGNVLACMIFGIVACRLATFRQLMATKAMKYIIGIMSIFQLWINMNGIREIWTGTPIGTIGGTTIVYVVCIGFIIILLKFGMIRNVLTDTVSWVIVYALILGVIIAALLINGVDASGISWGLDAPSLRTGAWKGFLLLPGPFTYPYFYALLDYNDKNDDGTGHCNIRRSFIMGGALFGVYMVFTFMAAFTSFGPVLAIIEAALISVVGISTISTFLYSEYIVFGENAGAAIDILSVLFWPMLIGLGVMGVWTLMSEIRIYLIAVLIVIALIRKAVKAKGVRS